MTLNGAPDDIYKLFQSELEEPVYVPFWFFSMLSIFNVGTRDSRTESVVLNGLST